MPIHKFHVEPLFNDVGGILQIFDLFDLYDLEKSGFKVNFFLAPTFILSTWYQPTTMTSFSYFLDFAQSLGKMAIYSPTNTPASEHSFLQQTIQCDLKGFRKLCIHNDPLA